MIRNKLHSILLGSILAFSCEMPGLLASDDCIPGLDRNCRVAKETDGREFCAKESDYKSIRSDQPVRVEFTNATNGRINIYWLDNDGHRVIYNILKKGDSHS